MAEISIFTVAPRKGDPPFNPYVHLWLSQHSRDSNGKILLSPELVNDVEIDESVNYLIQQLEKARKTAKKKLQRKKDQLRKSMQR